MLSLARYRFEFRAIDAIRFPSFPGSAVRGVFGHALKRAVCITRLEKCGECALRRECVHSVLFETAHTVEGGRNAPHPLIFDVHSFSESIDPGDSFVVEATMIGQAARHFPFVLEAWRRAGEHGFGRERARFDVSAVDALDFTADRWRPVYREGEYCDSPAEPYHFAPVDSPPENRVQVELLTPYRGKRDGRLVTPATFSAPGFVTALIHRIERLRQLYDADAELATTKLLSAAVSLVMDDARLQWTEWVRYSSRQKTHMNLGGVTGSFSIDGPEFIRVWPVLRAGELIQAGKNTLFGLGRYRLVDTSTGTVSRHA